MPRRLQGVFKSARMKLASMVREESRGRSNRNSHSGIGSDSRVGTWGDKGAAPRPRKQDEGSDLCPHGRPTGPSGSRVQSPDEGEPPFLNGSDDLFGAETFNHLRQGDPVA